jgi:hypothetical protein
MHPKQKEGESHGGCGHRIALQWYCGSVAQLGQNNLTAGESTTEGLQRGGYVAHRHT